MSQKRIIKTIKEFNKVLDKKNKIGQDYSKKGDMILQ